MKRMTGGQAVAAALKIEGIQHVFGIVGTHDSPLFDGVFDDPSIHVVTVRHEQGAALMAAGYARFRKNRCLLCGAWARPHECADRDGHGPLGVGPDAGVRRAERAGAA